MSLAPGLSHNGIRARGRWAKERRWITDDSSVHALSEMSAQQWAEEVELPECGQATLLIPQRAVFDAQGCGFALWDASYLLARLVTRALVNAKREKAATKGDSLTAGSVLARSSAAFVSSFRRALKQSSEKASRVPSVRVVELGAGTGLVGLALRHALHYNFSGQAAGETSDHVSFCSELILTDSAPPVLTHLRRVICANDDSTRCIDNPGSSHCDVYCESLSWGVPATELTERLRSPADIIVASDVIYSAEAVPLLVQSLLDLSTPETWIVCANEDHAGIRSLFYETARKFFTIEFENLRDSDVWHASLHNEEAECIDVIVMHRIDSDPHEVIDRTCSPVVALDNLFSMIHEAAKRGHSGQVQQILAAHPDAVSWRDGLGNTPLHWAASGGHESCVRLLLELGADALSQNSAGVDAVSRAMQRGNSKIAELIRQQVHACIEASECTHDSDSDIENSDSGSIDIDSFRTELDPS